MFSFSQSVFLLLFCSLLYTLICSKSKKKSNRQTCTQYVCLCGHFLIFVSHWFVPIFDSRSKMNNDLYLQHIIVHHFIPRTWRQFATTISRKFAVNQIKIYEQDKEKDVANIRLIDTATLFFAISFGNDSLRSGWYHQTFATPWLAQMLSMYRSQQSLNWFYSLNRIYSVDH